MHDDMADAKITDPIARESTRVLFTVTKAPQPSLDPKQLVEWIPNSEYGGHAFGYLGKTRKETFAPFLTNREKHLTDLHEWSPMSHAGADDPPAIILTTKEDKPPVKGEPQKDPAHSAVLGLMLQSVLEPLGVKCEVRHPLDDGRLRAYYRGKAVANRDGSEEELTCCAESADERAWNKPEPGIHEVPGTRKNTLPPPHQRLT